MLELVVPAPRMKAGWWSKHSNTPVMFPLKPFPSHPLPSIHELFIDAAPVEHQRREPQGAACRKAGPSLNQEASCRPRWLGLPGKRPGAAPAS